LRNPRKVGDEISKCDIMLNFSDSESLSRVTMEALYTMELPIIATNVGGTNEMIIHEHNGDFS
jgi:glycosyltransferase involved in cell wall biosynthesis